MNLLKFPVFISSLILYFTTQDLITADLNQTQEKFSAKVVKIYSYNYLKYLPKNYDGKTKFPLLLFLHGAGERGSNLEKVAVHGPPKLIKQGKQFPFIVISPQCPKGSRWDPDALNAMLDQIIKSHAVDETRIYCTGLSMGGFGTWALGSSNPNRFAAFAPICGGGVDRTAFVSFEMAKKPVWVFHGDADSVVPLKESERMVKALKRRGGKPKFTVYKGVNHDSWTETYNNPKLYEWFLSHKKN